MHFEVVGELTARINASGVMMLRPSRPTRPPAQWLGVRRELRVTVPLDVGLAVLSVYRGEVTVQGRDSNCTRTTAFSGPARYLAAQRALRRLRVDASRRAEERRQLSRMPD